MKNTEFPTWELGDAVATWAARNTERAAHELITMARILSECELDSGKSSQIAASAVLRSLGWTRSKQRVIDGVPGRTAWTPPKAAQPAPIPPTLEQLGASHRERRFANDTRNDLRRALERIDELNATVAAYERFTSEPLRPVTPAVLRPGKRSAAAVALLSDVHAEERVVRTDAIPNEYDLTIAERRVARFFEAVVWLTRTASATFDIGTVVLWLGGDLISGDIHDELLETCAVPPAEAMLTVRAWIASGLKRMLQKLPDASIVVPCSLGNHARTTPRMRAATGYGHSWEWVLYQVLAHDFRDEPRVKFHATRDEMQYLQVFDTTLAFHHGHRLRYNGGIGGLTIPMIKAVHRWQQWRDCDYYHFGHFHTRANPSEQIMVNGSVIGPSPYSFAIGAAPEPPVQSFFVLDAKRGKTMSSPIWVHEGDDR